MSPTARLKPAPLARLPNPRPTVLPILVQDYDGTLRRSTIASRADLPTDAVAIAISQELRR